MVCGASAVVRHTAPTELLVAVFRIVRRAGLHFFFDNFHNYLHFSAPANTVEAYSLVSPCPGPHRQQVSAADQLSPQ